MLFILNSGQEVISFSFHLLEDFLTAEDGIGDDDDSDASSTSASSKVNQTATVYIVNKVSNSLCIDHKYLY